jgi:hypothetical protein
MMKKLEPAVAEAVARAISDETERKILISTNGSAKSVEEISAETGIPLSTCYRAVHELVSLRLMNVKETIVTEKGKKFEKFIRTFKHLHISLDAEGLLVWDDDPPIYPTTAVEV